MNQDPLHSCPVLPSSVLTASWASPRRHLVPYSTSARVKVYFLLDRSLFISLIFRGMVSESVLADVDVNPWCQISWLSSEMRIFE